MMHNRHLLLFLRSTKWENNSTIESKEIVLHYIFCRSFSQQVASFLVKVIEKIRKAYVLFRNA
jgi:hypothetical protein